MKKVFFCLALQALLLSSMFATQTLSEGVPYPYYDHVDPSVWEQLAPYFLPEDHHLKPVLDKIFREQRVTESVKSLKKSHFKIISKQKWSDTYVVSHKKLKRYLVKLYLDSKTTKNDWAAWLSRIRGAQFVQESIERNGYQKYFKVPKKWIYPLPEHPSPDPNFQGKNFVLVVEDMDILDRRKNDFLWKSNVLTEDLLDAIFVILQEVGLSDSIYPFNLPFSNDGRVAHIDTEFYHQWPVAFNRLTKFLSKKNQAYWNMLIANGGPP